MIQARPGLGIFLAWTVMLSFRTDFRPLVLTRLQQAEQALETQEHPPVAAVGQGGALVPLRAWVTGQSSALRSQLLLAAFHEPVDPRELMRLSLEVFELLPEVEKAVRAIGAGTLAMSYLMVGDAPEAHTVFGKSEQLCLEAGNYVTFENAFFYWGAWRVTIGQDRWRFCLRLGQQGHQPLDWR